MNRLCKTEEVSIFYEFLEHATSTSSLQDWQTIKLIKMNFAQCLNMI